MICVNSKIFRYNIKKVMNNVTGDNMLFKKQKKKQQGVTIEENTQIFIEDFKKLVDEGKKESVRSVIKFMATLYLIFDYPYKYYTFKHFEV